MQKKQQISNRQSHHPLPIAVSNKLNSCIKWSESNFTIEKVANDTIESNYNLSKEYEQYVLQVNNLHDQISNHQEITTMLRTQNEQKIISLLDDFQRKFTNINMMQRILKFQNSPSSISNFNMYSLLYADIARLSSRLNHFFQGAFENSNINAYISSKYADKYNKSILSIMTTDHLLRQMVAYLIKRNTISSCDCTIPSILTSNPIIVQPCKSARCTIKWINDSVEAVQTLRELTGHSNHISGHNSVCQWPNWNIFIYKFIELNHYCPSDMKWLNPIQSNTIPDNTHTDDQINAACLDLLTIADRDKDLQNDS